jgi:hypothetical protein
MEEAGATQLRPFLIALYSPNVGEGVFSEVRRTCSLISPLYSLECLESSPGLLFHHDTEVVDSVALLLLNEHL